MIKDSYYHPSHFHRPDHIGHNLYVIAPIFNPQRYRSRWKLYKDFENMVLSNEEAYLVTIECTFGKRTKVFEEQVSPRHKVIHVQTHHELWIKENLINLAIQRLPDDWEYVAWIDPDTHFARPDWVGETLHLLQHYQVIQMFSEAVDLSPKYEIINKFKGWMWCYLNEYDNMPGHDCYYHDGGMDKIHWHPGFAWAARREAINHLGTLIDWAILGSGDRHMAAALIGQVRTSINPRISKRYKDMLDEWQARAEKHIKRNVGYMDGLLLHHWHGKKSNRGYKDRWRILVDHKYDPHLDIKRDSQGIFQLTDRSFKLRDNIRAYFKQRDEDSIDL